MSWVAVAIAGGSLVGAYATSRAADNAADAQRDAAAQSNAMQQYMYDQTRTDLQPYRIEGRNALSALSGNQFMNNFKGDPGFQFRMNEGMKAIEGSAAARGGLNSGATLKALTRYGQDYASNEYQNAYGREFNRLSTLLTSGQNSATQTGMAGQNYANAYGQNLTGAANATAAAELAKAQGYSNLANNGLAALAYTANRPAAPAAPAQGGGYGAAGGGYNNFGNMA